MSEKEKEELKYRIGVTLLPGIGDITARKLIAYCGSAYAVFRERKANLMKIPGIGEILADNVSKQQVLSMAEQEVEFVNRYHIKALYYLDEDYPNRLKQCIDSPVLLYFKGNANLDAKRIVGIVGTRKATIYGKTVCRRLVEGLKDEGVLVVSGLAYGIDTCSHRAALDHGLMTVGVLAHGLDRIYPPANKKLAEKMLSQGGLVTDFISGTNPDRENFPKRNRIIAGLSDAVIVVEAAESGGALITADIANSYNRDVFAIPGRWGDEYSCGCNALIRTNRAALIQSPDDIKLLMSWTSQPKHEKSRQTALFLTLKPDEELIVHILQENGAAGIDLITLAAGISQGRVATALLSLEMQEIIRALPGKRYDLAI